MIAQRIYGPKGFTRTDEIRELLDPLEVPDWDESLDEAEVVDLDELDEEEGWGADIVRFDGLTVEAARRLLALMPPKQALMRQNFAPSFLEMAALGERCPGLLFHGYRVPACREDERVTIEGFYVPADCAAEVLAMLIVMPDEWGEVEIEGQPYFRAWWD